MAGEREKKYMDFRERGWSPESAMQMVRRQEQHHWRSPESRFTLNPVNDAVSRVAAARMKQQRAPTVAERIEARNGPQRPLSASERQRQEQRELRQLEAEHNWAGVEVQRREMVQEAWGQPSLMDEIKNHESSRRYREAQQKVQAGDTREAGLARQVAGRMRSERARDVGRGGR